MDRLPNEIIMKILTHLNTYDLIQFCSAFDKYSYFLNEKNVIKKVDISSCFELCGANIYKQIIQKLDYVFIRTLMINGLYWVKLQDLRKLIGKLPNLKELQAIDTKLMLAEEDILIYNKLTKLSVTCDDGLWKLRNNTMPADYPLKSLFIKTVLGRDTNEHIVDFLQFCKQILKKLEELWIFDIGECPYRLCFKSLINHLKNLKKIVMCIRWPMPPADEEYLDFYKIFECKRNNCETEVIFEKELPKLLPIVKRSIFEPVENPLERAWDLFVNLKKSLPCGPKEQRLIHLKNDIKNIYFEDLNFCHTIILCNRKYIEAALQILSSRNSANLKRLAFRSCLFLGDSQSTLDDQACSTSSKRARVGLQILKDHPFEQFAKNLRNLTELEISICTSCISGPVLSAYRTIALFKNLEKLSLEISNLIDGFFLKEVFIKCDRLKFLRLTCVSQNEKFILNLCHYLKYTASLRDLRLEHTNIIIDKLFEGLNEIKDKKLLRMVLKCDHLKTASIDYNSLDEFLQKNPQIIFLFMIVSKTISKHKNVIQRILNKHKSSNPARIYFVKNNLSNFNGVFPIPTAHHDLIFNRTFVSVINFDEF